MEHLTPFDFAESFGVDQNTFSDGLLADIASFDFSFERAEHELEKSLILEVLKKINSDKQVIGAKERTSVWFDGWKENLDEFRSSNFDKSTLVPKFVRPGNPVRWRQRYIFPKCPNFELQFIKVYLRWFAETYFQEIDVVHEFGCGTGHNLLSMSEIFPNKSYIGSDFVDSSVELIREIARTKDTDISAANFNMLTPQSDYIIGKNDGVFTFGSLEQLAGDIQPMINFLVKKRPKIVVHTEPVEEFYDLNNLEDYLAFIFQNKRGYSSGLIQLLRSLEEKGVIEIIKMKRLNFGSFFMEGYNHIVWKPI